MVPACGEGWRVAVWSCLLMPDAVALRELLRRDGFADAAVRRNGMLHVELGPYRSREEAAERTRRLLCLGYKAAVVYA